jgi:hypothetical protein
MCEVWASIEARNPELNKLVLFVCAGCFQQEPWLLTSRFLVARENHLDFDHQASLGDAMRGWEAMGERCGNVLCVLSAGIVDLFPSPEIFEE